MDAYPHLHVHSCYTLLGATPAPDELARQAAADGLTHLALTDTNALYGAVAFDRACRSAGVQPLLGLTVTVAWPDDLGAPPPPRTTPGLLVLLARNADGYRSLSALSSQIQTDPDREARALQGVPLHALRAHREGLICLTGGRCGYAWRSLAAGMDDAAHRFLGRLCGIYGPEDTYVSLELHGPDDAPLVAALDAKAGFLGLKTVAVQPIYALTPEDKVRLRLLAAIDRNCRLEAVPPEVLPDGGDARIDVHWLDATDLANRFGDYPGALARTHEVARRCTPEDGSSVLPSSALHWPEPILPPGQTPATALALHATAGCRTRYGVPDGAPLPAPVAERLERELNAINRHGYAPLFLIVADITRYAREREVPVSTRGSVANALVAYALGITTVDPLAHGLLFERFLSPGRADPPDIDLDFCSRRRDEVQDYIRRTYGAGRVALVGAMATLRLRSAARETAKAYGLDEQETQSLVTALREGPRGPRFWEARPLEEALADLPSAKLQAVARAAYSVTGLPHHLSIHAAGLIITPGPLTDLVPVQMSPKGYLTTQFDHGDCEAIGLPKLDLLGIRALTVLADAAEKVRERDPSFRLIQIPPDDTVTADLLERGDTIGVFQCDSIGARRTLRKLRARTVRDLAIANAFFKPGPATGGQADIFVRRYRGEAPTHYLHPALEPILAPTKGVLIFQEQVLRVATEIAGLDWAQAGAIRRGMSKMNAETMTQLRDAFIAGCQRPAPGGPAFTAQQAEQLWEQVAAFSGYGFNQGHATAYADVSYRSAYMKAHWPAEFFWARLRNYGGYHHPAVYMAEAVRLGIDVRMPHVNHSRAGVILAWEQERPVLWLGLELVRDLRRKAVADLLRARDPVRGEGAGQHRPFTDLRDLLMRVPLQAKEVLHLIQCGALDGLGANRPAMVQEAEMSVRAGTARQLAFDFATGYAPPAPRRQHLAWERSLLGFPLGALRDWLPELATTVPGCVPVAQLDRTRGSVATVGVRLPGWHRGGYALWDGISWTWTEVAQGTPTPPAWDPIVVRGQWHADRWGMGWLIVERWEKAPD